MAIKNGPSLHKEEATKLLGDIGTAIKSMASKIDADKMSLEFSSGGFSGKIEVSESKIRYFLKENGEYAPVSLEAFKAQAGHYDAEILGGALDDVNEELLRKKIETDELRADSIIVDDDVKQVERAEELEEPDVDAPVQEKEVYEHTIDDITDMAQDEYQVDVEKAIREGKPAAKDEISNDEDELIPGRPRRPY